MNIRKAYSLSIFCSLFLLLVAVTPIHGQTSKTDSLKAQLELATSDEERLPILISLMNGLSRSDLDASDMYADECMTIAKELNDEKAIADAWYGKAWVYDSRSQQDKAYDAYQRAYEIYERLDDQRNIVRILVNLARHFHEQGDSEMAEKQLVKAQQIATNLEDISLQVMVLNNLGVFYAMEGKLEDAQQCWTETLHKAFQVGDTIVASDALGNLGASSYEMGNFELAIDYYLKTARIDKARNNLMGLAISYRNISVLLKRLGNTDGALDYNEASMRIRQQRGDVTGVALCLHNKADILTDLGRTEEAYQYELQALDTCIAHNLEGDIWGSIYTGLAYYHREKDRPEVALTWMKKAEENYLKYSRGKHLATAYHGLGQILTDLGRYSEATSYLEKALERNQEMRTLPKEQKLHEDLAEAYTHIQRYDLASKHHKLAAELKDSLYRVENNAKIMEIQSKYDLEKKRREIAEQQQQNDQLSYERDLSVARNRTLWVGIIGLALLGVSVILLLLYRANQRRKFFKQEQILAAQELAQEKREKDRIQKSSERLVLDIGRKNRLVNELNTEIEKLRSRNTHLEPKEFIHLFKVVEQNIKSEDDWQDFKTSFEKLHPGFLSILKREFPGLSPAETRLCVLLRLGMNQKDIANILNINPDSVKRARNRLRNKMRLEEGTNLRDFLTGISRKAS